MIGCFTATSDLKIEHPQQTLEGNDCSTLVVSYFPFHFLGSPGSWPSHELRRTLRDVFLTATIKREEA